MSYYRTCPYCGLHLGPGEICDCPSSKYDRLTDENKQIVNDKIEALVTEAKSGKYVIAKGHSDEEIQL